MKSEHFQELERGIKVALETYSNVHRGTGHNSLITTYLYERARKIILEHLKLEESTYIVIFCSLLRLIALKRYFKTEKSVTLSSKDIGLPLGLRAFIVKRTDLSRKSPSHTGGGMVSMVYSRTALWAADPDRYEAGTPNIINAITFAKALLLRDQFGDNIFNTKSDHPLSAKKILYQDELLDIKGFQLLKELRKTLIGYNNKVPIRGGDSKYINLDNAASTPTFSPIWNVVRQILHQPERIQRKIISEVKEICQTFFDFSQDEHDLIFTSNTTEAINICVQNLIDYLEDDTEPIIINSILEHNSNELPWRYIPKVTLKRLSIDKDGFIDLNSLENILMKYNTKKNLGNKRVKIVSISGASNVLGSYNDITEISRLAHKYGAYILVDGAQLVAHSKISLKDSNIDFFAFSGHKMYAPFGTGGLIYKKELFKRKQSELRKIKLSGEENVIGIASVGKALNLLERIGLDVIESFERELTQKALIELQKVNSVEIYGVKNPLSPKFKQRGGTLVFSLKKVPHNLVAKELAEIGGVGVRNGCFCAHLLVKDILKIPKFRLLGAWLGLRLLPKITNILLPGLVRVSFGIENVDSDVDFLITTLKYISKQPRSLVNRIIANAYSGTIFLSETETQREIERFINNSVDVIYSTIS
jgi:selenocysteine lyase/cysteine desulfurase